MIWERQLYISDGPWTRHHPPLSCTVWALIQLYRPEKRCGCREVHICFAYRQFKQDVATETDHGKREAEAEEKSSSNCVMWQSADRQKWPPQRRRGRRQEGSRWEGTSPPLAGLDGCSRWPERAELKAAGRYPRWKTQHSRNSPRQPWERPWRARAIAVWRLRWGKPRTSVRCWKSADFGRPHCVCTCRRSVRSEASIGIIFITKRAWMSQLSAWSQIHPYVLLQHMGGAPHFIDKRKRVCAIRSLYDWFHDAGLGVSFHHRYAYSGRWMLHSGFKTGWGDKKGQLQPGAGIGRTMGVSIHASISLIIFTDLSLHCHLASNQLWTCAWQSL